MDADFWKRIYRRQWDRAAERERAIAERIEAETGWEVLPWGLGAGSTDYLSGSAASHDHERGGPDLWVAGTNVYLEVTGPQTEAVTYSDPLWVRPDKIEHARSHPEQDICVIHWLERDGTLRVMHLDERFFVYLNSADFRVIHPRLKGEPESYYEIPAGHPCVRKWTTFIRWLGTPNAASLDWS